MTLSPPIFADRTPGEHIASWINYAVVFQRDGLDIDAIILAPHLTRYARAIFRGVEPLGPVRPVERPLFEPYDVAVLFHDDSEERRNTVALIKWVDGDFQRHPGIAYVSARSWSEFCAEGWNHDRTALSAIGRPS